MFEISLPVIIASITSPIAAIYALKHVLSFFHNAKSKVDEFQKTVSRGAGVCRQAQLPLLEGILNNAAALDYDDGIRAIEQAVNSVDTVPELIAALEDNFVWQFGHRGKSEEGVKLIVESCLDNQAIRAGIVAGFESEEKAAADAEVLKKATALVTAGGV